MRIENLKGEQHELSREEDSARGNLGAESEGVGREGKARGAKADGAVGGAKADGEMVISEIRQGVKNPNRANIFVNGKFAFSLDVAQMVELKVRMGEVLTAERLAELRKASEFGKLYQRTLEWVLARPRSVRETRDYLRRKIYEKKLDAGFQEQILERLLQKGYLDDRKFAAYYVENRFVKKGIARKRLRLELTQKGVAKEIIEQALTESERDEAEEAKKMIAKKRARYDDEHLISYLCRQGFSYQLARSLVLDCEKD